MAEVRTTAMAPGEPPATAFLPAGEVIAWIAFRHCVPWSRWAEDLVEPPGGRGWKCATDVLLEALDARANGEVWRPAERPGIPAWGVRMRVRQLMRESGLDCAALVEELRADLAWMGDRWHRLRAAQDELREAVARGDLPAFGRRWVDRSKGRFEPDHIAIPPLFFADPDRTIIGYGEARLDPVLGVNGLFRDDALNGFGDVRFRTADMLGLWPVPAPQTAVVATIAAEVRLEDWLVARMRANPGKPPGKETVKSDALAAGHRVAGRAFTRAYANAVKRADAPAWSQPGRKSTR